jgi:hypothetical protein
MVPVNNRRAAEQMLGSAKIRASWATAPSAEEILKRDERNLISEIVEMAGAPAEEDLAVGRQLLEELSAEEIAAVLVRNRRELLPAPEVLKKVSSDRREHAQKHSGAKKKFGAPPPWKAVGKKKKPAKHVWPKAKKRH